MGKMLNEIVIDLSIQKVMRNRNMVLLHDIGI